MANIDRRQIAGLYADNLFIISGSVSSTLPKLVAAASGSASAPSNETGTIATTLPKLKASGTASYAAPTNETGTIASTLPNVKASGSGSFIPTNETGTIATVLKCVVLTGTGTYAPNNQSGTATINLTKLSAALAGTFAAAGTVTGTLATILNKLSGALSGSASAPSNETGTLASNLPHVKGAGSGSYSAPSNETGTIAANLAHLTASGSGAATAAGSATGTLETRLKTIVLAITGNRSSVAPVVSDRRQIAGIYANQFSTELQFIGSAASRLSKLTASLTASYAPHDIAGDFSSILTRARFSAFGVSGSSPTGISVSDRRHMTGLYASRLTSMGQYTGTCATRLGKLTSAGTGSYLPNDQTGTIAATLKLLAINIVAIEAGPRVGMVTSTLKRLKPVLLGGVWPSGLGAFQGDAFQEGGFDWTGVFGWTGSLAARLPSLTLAASGSRTIPTGNTGTFASVLRSLSSTASGSSAPPTNEIGHLITRIPHLILTGSGLVGFSGEIVGQITAVLPKLESLGSGDSTGPTDEIGPLDATLKSLALSGEGLCVPLGEIGGRVDAVLPAIFISGRGEIPIRGDVAANLAKMQARMRGHVPQITEGESRHRMGEYTRYRIAQARLFAGQKVDEENSELMADLVGVE